MKLYQAIILLLSASIAQAQLDLPTCSLDCFIEAMTHDGCPNLMDFACHCRQPALVNEVAPCVQQACDLEDQSSVSNAVVTECSSQGVPISIPPVGSTTQTSPIATTTLPPNDSSPSPSGPAVTLPTSTPSILPSNPVDSSTTMPSSTPVYASDPPASSQPFVGGAGLLDSGGRLAGAAAAVAAGLLL
ncbi:hypothetical protein BJX61DRAFT_131496 [Aspergillus egyptiacus]|nr:hypothetical protein BJX61DRAFT_131496 [Aspergillus egyptiacus]